MSVATKTLEQFQADLLDRWASNIEAPVPTDPKDPMVGLANAVGAQLIFLQSLVLLMQKFARGSTAEKEDLDSWLADFGFTRDPAVAAKGPVVLGALSSHNQPTPIAVGRSVQTRGGTVKFTIIADTDNPAFDVTNNRYVLPAGQSNVTVTVQATAIGASGNVNAHTIVELGSAIPGIDTVDNTVAFTTGSDGEEDAAAFARFLLYLQSLAQATRAAILSAIGKVAGLTGSALIEYAAAGSPPTGLLGAFLVVASDTDIGTLTSDTRAELYANVDAARAFTVMPFVQAPNVVTANLVFSIRVRVGANVPAATATAQAAAIAAINGLGIGATLYLNQVVSAIEAASVDIVAVKPGSCLINTKEKDLTALAYETIRAGTVTVGTY